MDPWWKIVTLRREVREGRSFSPDEFAIALEQVVAGSAPEDYRDPAQFFSRTCFTRALREHAGMVLRRLAGETENTAPVLTLITQFGGGKTHTLTALYHLARAGAQAARLPGAAQLLKETGMAQPPCARVGVFVGNAWDPAEGRETPWRDLARQLAGDQGVAALGAAARTAPPGTEALARVFAAADAPVLLLFDEVLNFVNRHRAMAEGFHAFLQNLTVAVTGTTYTAAVISLPRSQVEMTDWDQQWQGRITKVVRRVARDLIANDESEISEVVRRRLFEDLGKERVRRKVARTCAHWCLERSARLPPEWLAVDTAKTEARAREFLARRFEACYPFHPATLSVFQRKWRALVQFQQTRGALAMLAQWVSWAARDQFQKVRKEPLITLGSAPLHAPEFRAVLLGQLGEERLDAALDVDLAGETSHARALDADARGALREIHQRVGAAILFESSGGQKDKVAHLPELRFALGGPEVETTSIDNAAAALESAGFFIRKLGSDGYRIHHRATLKKVVSDRRASLDEEGEIRPALRKLVEDEFRRGAALPVAAFPEDSASVQDSPRLALIVLDPEEEWRDGGPLIERIADWTRQRGGSPRLYPGSLVWCARKPGRGLQDKVEWQLAWQRVGREASQGILGEEFDRAERTDVQARIKDAEKAAREEVWASYRYVALLDANEESGLRIIDLGAGHSSAAKTLCARILRALTSEALLNESVGAGYIDRHWPPALRDAGAWPLSSLRQSFLDGSLTRLIDPDTVLRRQIAEFVAKGEFGLASGPAAATADAAADDACGRVWFAEPLRPEEIAFESSVFLLTRVRAQERKKPPGDGGEDAPAPQTGPAPRPAPGPHPEPGPGSPPRQEAVLAGAKTRLRLAGDVPPEVWNRLGTKVLPRLRSDGGLTIDVEFTATIDARRAGTMEAELRQILDELGLGGKLRIERL